MIKYQQKLKNKNGMALIITTVVLLVVLLLTVSSLQNSSQNKRAATNFHTKLKRDAAAEAAAREAEQYIKSQTHSITDFVENCSNGLCLQDRTKKSWKNNTLWQGAKELSGDIKQKLKLKENPQYIIEYIGDKSAQDSLSVGDSYGGNEDTSSKPVYRVTGKSKGEKGDKETVIQTIIY